MNYNNITIIGAGHGGYAAASDLILKGFNVCIYELPEFQENLFPLIESGKIKLTGEKQGIVRVSNVVVNIDEAIINAEIILVIVHAAAHKRIAELISPYLKDNQIIVIMPGYTGGALVFHEIFKKNSVNQKYILAETNTLPYACRKVNKESAVHMKLYVKKVLVSAFPAKFNHFVFDVLKKLYPNISLVNNVLETGFNNGNPVLNVAPCIFNAGRIEYAKGEYYHFQEGITPSIAGVLENIDNERISIARYLGINAPPYLERVLETGYITNNEGWFDAISTSPHLTAKGPEKLTDRYITEDVPYGLIPWYYFAKQGSIEINLITSLIHLASSLNNEDYFKIGRNLTDLGLKDLGPEDMHKYLKNG